MSAEERDFGNLEINLTKFYLFRHKRYFICDWKQKRFVVRLDPTGVTKFFPHFIVKHSVPLRSISLNITAFRCVAASSDLQRILSFSHLPSFLIPQTWTESIQLSFPVFLSSASIVDLEEGSNRWNLHCSPFTNVHPYTGVLSMHAISSSRRFNVRKDTKDIAIYCNLFDSEIIILFLSLNKIDPLQLPAMNEFKFFLEKAFPTNR